MRRPAALSHDQQILFYALLVERQRSSPLMYWLWFSDAPPDAKTQWTLTLLIIGFCSAMRPVSKCG